MEHRANGIEMVQPAFAHRPRVRVGMFRGDEAVVGEEDVDDRPRQLVSRDSREERGWRPIRPGPHSGIVVGPRAHVFTALANVFGDLSRHDVGSHAIESSASRAAAIAARVGMLFSRMRALPEAREEDQTRPCEWQ